MKSRLLLLPLALLAAGQLLGQPQPAAPAPAPEPLDAKIFDYDRSAPFDLREIGRETRDGALVRDITFVGTTNPVTAYLVSPAQPSGPQAAVLWVHWFGEPATTNRTQFLSEAVALAQRGVVSLLVDGMWSKREWWKGRTRDTDLPAGINQVIELRRALDLLLAQPGVDAGRVAIVGHDFGAMYASIAGALDERVKTFVLAAPTPRMSNWYLFTYKYTPEETAAYRALLRPIDPIEWAGKLAPRAVFFQFAANDRYVPTRHATEYYDAVKPRKVMATYETDHDMHLPAVAEDRAAWLVRELGLK
jgi:dienelactone hydrolase